MPVNRKKSPIKNKCDVGTPQKPIIQFEYDGVVYRMHYFADSMAHAESDNLNSVTWDKDKRLYTITTKTDFGGCGKDAWKPHIQPLESWLRHYCYVHQVLKDKIKS